MHDLFFIRNYIKWINWFKQQFDLKFEMSKLGKSDLTLYLKVKIIKVPQGMFMIQRNYVHQVLCNFRLKGCQLISTSMLEHLKLTLDMHEDTMDPTHYRSIVGKLIQLIHSWLDLSYSINIVSCFMMKPQISHLINNQKNFDMHSKNTKLWHLLSYKFNHNHFMIYWHNLNKKLNW